jgi:hypothetical protein
VSEVPKSKKQEVLDIIHNDKSKPTKLKLRTGETKKLADGVFIKKKRNGKIEILTHEE